MLERVQHSAGTLTSKVSRWQGVEAVLLGEAAEIDRYDPYFSIDLFVFHRLALPAAEERIVELTGTAAFESSGVQVADRFLFDELPVTLSYYQIDKLDSTLARAEERLWALRESGTKMLYRLQRGHPLHQSSGWLQQARGRLEQLPESFWHAIILSARAALEVDLRYINAAVHRQDDLIYLSASATFVHNVISFLFAYNRQFESSGRLLQERLRALPRLPDGFLGRLDAFVRSDSELGPQQKREIAELIARSVFELSD